MGGYGGARYPNFEPTQGAPYLTAQSDYMTDTNVNKLLSKSMPNANGFSVDALGNVPPELRAMFADAVAGAGGDPYGAYSAMNMPEYQAALVQQLAGNIGGVVPDGYVINVHGQMVPGQNSDKIMYKHTGDPEADAAAQQAATEGYAKTYGNNLLEDAFFSAAPSTQRNTQQIDELYGRFGGMPYPGAGSDAGASFGGGGGGAGGQDTGGRDPYTEELLHMAVQAGAIPPPPKPQTHTPMKKSGKSATTPYRDPGKRGGGKVLLNEAEWRSRPAGKPKTNEAAWRNRPAGSGR